METKQTTPEVKKIKTPKLVCVITGKSRNTTREYLDSRLARLNCSEEQFVANYANKEAIKYLREGKSVEQIRAITQSDAKNVITPEHLKIILAFNGKQPKPLKVVTVKATESTLVAA